MFASTGDFLKPYPYYACLVGFLLSCLVFRNAISAWRRNPAALPHPPGPKGLPLIGSFFNLPADNPWLVYDKWQKIYGDMVYFEVLGKPFLILGSPRRTTDLLEKRSSICSDRPRMVMVKELMGWDYDIAFQCYGSWWRRHRRIFHEFFQPRVVSNYEAIQTRETVNLLQRLLETPEEFVEHILHIFQAMVMDIIYGIKVQETGDPHIERSSEILKGVVDAGLPGGRFLVDMIPLLKYVPSWFPGAGFKRWAARHSSLNKQALTLPFEEVERRLKYGNLDDASSIAAALLKRPPQGDIRRREEDRTIAQNVLTTAALGGADTTSSSVQTFFLAMAMCPDVQKKAQSEIDRVVGSERLPDFNDRETLPYVNAIVKETLRWFQGTPLALPHASTEDMEYDGYFIPKGTYLIGNAWSIMHDPEEYSDPGDFCPERFLKDGQLNPDVRQPDSAAFGFGRRSCPGKPFALNSFYSVVASVLAVYDIAPPIDSQGYPIKLEAKFTTGMMCYPVNFRCSIQPRNEAARRLILEVSARQKKSNM